MHSLIDLTSICEVIFPCLWMSCCRHMMMRLLLLHIHWYTSEHAIFVTFHISQVPSSPKHCIFLFGFTSSSCCLAFLIVLVACQMIHHLIDLIFRVTTTGRVFCTLREVESLRIHVSVYWRWYDGESTTAWMLSLLNNCTWLCSLRQLLNTLSYLKHHSIWRILRLLSFCFYWARSLIGCNEISYLISALSFWYPTLVPSNNLDHLFLISLLSRALFHLLICRINHLMLILMLLDQLSFAFYTCQITFILLLYETWF